jgi:hypothetical protein
MIWMNDFAGTWMKPSFFGVRKEKRQAKPDLAPGGRPADHVCYWHETDVPQ